jgi:hypothetical protein
MNSDTRKTIPGNGSFYPVVKELFESKQNAGILYEDNGVTRANGYITALFDKDGKSWIKLDGHLEIAVDQLYAVNGTFSSDYSEC